MKYRGCIIEKSGEVYIVRKSTGEKAWAEPAVNRATAKRWIDAHLAEVRTKNIRRFSGGELSDADVISKFEKNRFDFMLDDTKVIWAGASVQLYAQPEPGKLGALCSVFNASTQTIKHIMRWCVKNSYRCSQIQNGKINL